MGVLYKTISTALTAIAVMTLPVMADAKSEAYVATNAANVLAALKNPELDKAQRSAKFNEYMDQFANIELISNFVIGKYSRRFTEAELDVYHAAFREYALTVYEAELDKFRGESISVEGSTDRNSRDSIVDTVIRSAEGEEMSVRWRVLTRDGEYQVVDVALNIEGNLVWLAIEQRAQFLALLDQNFGSADVLIDKLHDMTATLHEEMRAEADAISQAG
jgi:phospholipid transport system substrate-binding protein